MHNHSSDDSILSDIESQMFKYSDRTADSTKNSTISLNSNETKSLFVELVLKRTRNFKYNVAMAFLSGLKIVATLTAIVESPRSCPDILNIWIIVMAVYDLINVISRFMLIKLLIPKRQGNSPADPLVSGQPKDPAVDTTGDTTAKRKVTLINEFQFPFQFHEQKENKAIQVIAISRFFYLGLFVWSQFILYRHLRSCNQILNLRTALFYVYLCFGYIYLGIPILLFIADCIMACFCGIRDRFLSARTRARSDAEKIIIYRKYSVNLSGIHKCGICVKEYQEEDNLIQLQCNIDHHFHEKCLTHHMGKEKFCPLCGRKFSYNIDDSTTDMPRRSIANIFL